MKTDILREVQIIKIGGNVIDDEQELKSFLSKLSRSKVQFILVHGGGKLATQFASKLGIPQELIQGRRVTNAETLRIATMVYAGLINKQIVALLQAFGKDAIGLSGADLNCIRAVKRSGREIDYGFVGDLDSTSVFTEKFDILLQAGMTPVVCAITHDGKGQLLNTNADTIASSLAVAMSRHFRVQLNFCFEKKGVMKDVNDSASVIRSLNLSEYQSLKHEPFIQGGMLPKLENAFDAIGKGVESVFIGHSSEIEQMMSNMNYHGTVITA
jgi:acetylglutamate kinase